MERVVGIEPTFPAWKAGVLPIYDTRIFFKIIINFVLLRQFRYFTPHLCPYKLRCSFPHFLVLLVPNVLKLERKTGLEPATSTLGR